MEPPADSGPDREGGSSRRQFIRSLSAISAGLTHAAPDARERIPTGAGGPARFYQRFAQKISKVAKVRI